MIALTAKNSRPRKTSLTFSKRGEGRGKKGLEHSPLPFAWPSLDGRNYLGKKTFASDAHTH